MKNVGEKICEAFHLIHKYFIKKVKLINLKIKCAARLELARTVWKTEDLPINLCATLNYINKTNKYLRIKT